MNRIIISPINRMARPSLFGSSLMQTRGFHPTLSGNFGLGTTPEEWYERAKSAISKFEALLERLSRIASKEERDNLLAWVGTSADVDSPSYRYATVKYDLQEDVEKYTPPAVNAYQIERRTARIEKLEATDQELESKVTNAENAYGKLPESEPTVVEKPAPAKAKEETSTNLTLPLVVVGGAIVIAVAITVIFGGK